VQAALARWRRVPGGACRRPLRPAARKLHQRGQESGQRLACTGGGDEQGRAALLREREQVELVGTGAPAARGKPGAEAGGQQRVVLRLDTGGHVEELNKNGPPGKENC
jgi:hypothetical protein